MPAALGLHGGHGLWELPGDPEDHHAVGRLAGRWLEGLFGLSEAVLIALGVGSFSILFNHGSFQEPAVFPGFPEVF